MPGDGAEALIRRYFQTVKNDVANVRRLYAPDAVLTYAGRHRLGGIYRGPDQIDELFRRSRQAFGGSQRLDLHDVATSDQHAVALLNASAQHRGHTVSWHRIVVFHVRDGVIAEQWIHDSDQHLVEEVLGPPR